jgi:hypothetical protein
MTDPVHCAFCELPTPANQLRREYELDFCERCAVDLEGVMAGRRARGDAVQIREWTTEVYTGKRTQTFHHLEVSGVPRMQIPIDATFTREGAWARFLKLFSKEVQVGDPMFDDFIHIRTDDRAAAHAFLQHTGVQSVLMDLVGGHERVSFEHGAVTVHAQGTEPPASGYAVLPICALLVHAERLPHDQR